MKLSLKREAGLSIVRRLLVELEGTDEVDPEEDFLSEEFEQLFMFRLTTHCHSGTAPTAALHTAAIYRALLDIYPAIQDVSDIDIYQRLSTLYLELALQVQSDLQAWLNLSSTHGDTL